MADICGANVLTLCFPSPSAFFKREKTEFLKNKLKSFSYEGFQPFFLRKISLPEILFFSSILLFFLQKNIILFFADCFIYIFV